MAVCEIWDVRGRLDSPLRYASNPDKTNNPKYTEAEWQSLSDVMKYATNGDKTEQQFFVSGINCDPSMAREEMQIVKRQFQDESDIVCYHGFQSFREGEVTPEQAHEIGVKLAKKMWGDRFQVIVATHLNTGCLHNHFVLNSVSFTDGKHYHDNKANLKLLRQYSDELCREYALSVIENPVGKKKPYVICQAEKNGLPTRDSVARQAIDEAISKSYTMRDFAGQMKAMGYRVNFNPHHKYWTIQGEGWKRPKRLYRLGEDYTNEHIVESISENSYAVRFSNFAPEHKPVRIYLMKGSLKHTKKIGGLRGLYLHYCYKLGFFRKGRKQNPARLHYLLKDDLLKMEYIAQETRLLCRHHIDTAEQLFSYKQSLENELHELSEKRKALHSVNEKSPETDAQILAINMRLREIRKEVRQCDNIAERSQSLKEKLSVIRADEAKQREEMNRDGYERRGGGTGRPHELGGS